MLVSAVFCATVCLIRLEGQDNGINFDSSSLTREGGRIKVAVSYPNDYTNRLDLFSCSDLIKGEWRLVLTAGADLSAHRTEWIDPESLANPVRFYAAGNADITPATDPDGDGLPWGREVFFYRTSPTNADTDADGMPDGWEIQYGLNPVGNDSSNDVDKDGLSNFQEYSLNLDPTNPDSDGDGYPDGFEIREGSDPLSAATPRYDYGNIRITSPFGERNSLRSKFYYSLGRQCTVADLTSGIAEHIEGVVNTTNLEVLILVKDQESRWRRYAATVQDKHFSKDIPLFPGDTTIYVYSGISQSNDFLYVSSDALVIRLLANLSSSSLVMEFDSTIVNDAYHVPEFTVYVNYKVYDVTATWTCLHKNASDYWHWPSSWDGSTKTIPLNYNLDPAVQGLPGQYSILVTDSSNDHQQHNDTVQIKLAGSGTLNTSKTNITNYPIPPNQKRSVDWNVGGFVYHSGSTIGGYQVGPDKNLQLLPQATLLGYYGGTNVVFTGPNGLSDVYLKYGESAQFTATGDIEGQQQMNLLGGFDAGYNVFCMDGLGVFNGYQSGVFSVSRNGSSSTVTVHVASMPVLLKVDIAMDANRDLAIDFNNPADMTQGTNLFWINDDHDTSHYDGPLEPEFHEDDYSASGGGASVPNWNDNKIGAKGNIGGTPPASGQNNCLRDLEDFTVVQLKVPGVVSNLTGITYHLKLENCQGSPSINLFKAITNGVTAPFDYLTNSLVASNQVLETKAYTINTTEQQISTNYINRYDQPVGFLMEGCATGKADLVFILKKDGTELCRSKVQLDLRKITDFYDIYQTGKTITRRFGFLWETNPKWNVEVYTNAVHIQTNTAYTADADKYLLLVHGWNMSPDDKLYFAQTAFKRLWWQKYKGGFGLYDWPGLYDCPSIEYGINGNIHHYDDSEMIAWLSSTALAKVMESLNGSGNLRVWAHSMGNIVFGEAMTKYAGGQHIQTYIASQAAIPGSFYSQSATNTPITPETPNIIPYWHSGTTTNGDQPYMAGNAGKITGMCNYYNPEDVALWAWEINNRMKPDGAWGYGFGYGGSTNFYLESVTATNRFYRWWGYIEGLEITTNLNERYQVFSYNVESRACALGQASNPAFSAGNRNLYDPPLRYDNKHYSHSKQYRSNILDQGPYYKYVMQDGGF